MDRSPLSRMFANGHQTAIQGQVHFTKHGLPRAIPPVVRNLSAHVRFRQRMLTVQKSHLGRELKHRDLTKRGLLGGILPVV